jgi:ribosomal protein L29
MHPLVPELKELKTSEIESKINDLTRKYFMTQNTDLRNQIAKVLDVYKEEQSIRQRVEYEKMMNNRDKGLDKLINIQ